MEETTEAVSFYQAVGGEQTFRRLVGSFYRRVAGDPALRAVYPSKDLGPAEEHLRLFLIQYWGGRVPTTSGAGTPGCACGTPISPSGRRSGTPGYATCGAPSTRSASASPTTRSCG